MLIPRNMRLVNESAFASDDLSSFAIEYQKKENMLSVFQIYQVLAFHPVLNFLDSYVFKIVD
jgi:hypothetical protein